MKKESVKSKVLKGMITPPISQNNNDLKGFEVYNKDLEKNQIL